MNILTCFSPVSVGVDWRFIRVGLHSSVALWHGLGHCEDKSGDEDNLENINVDNMRSLGSSNANACSTFMFASACSVCNCMCSSESQLYLYCRGLQGRCSVHTWAAGLQSLAGTFYISQDRGETIRHS